MSRVPLHALIWSKEQRLYELYTQGQLKLRFQPADEAAWLAWLREATSFAFHGPSGSLNAYREARPRGGAYWYAYHTKEGRTRKRYLGRTENLSLAHLEDMARALSREQPPAQGMTLLSSSLAPPPLPAWLVERESLLIRLDAALAHPLTLVSAAAGWGKTTLLSAWAHRRKGQIAWLSLTALDNSPTRFWVGLITALRHGAHASPDLGQTAVALLQSPQPPELPVILTALLNELESREAHPASLVLIVDDYQVIGESAIHEGLSFFLEHLPAHLHLILSSRVDPDLPLARWRVRGQLAEIREADLRFSLQEASQYLGQTLSSTLAEDEMHMLLSRTEGWIAGLHLAVLALEKREDRTAFLQSFSGSQRSLVDYVQEEILARLPERVRDFLLHSAILSHLDASVCQAVITEPLRVTSQPMLEWLERANLFLVPLDEERRSYRLHELFREALLARLHTVSPELVPVLHRRAARFYEAQGEWVEALIHWFSARDFSAAAHLMEQTVEQFWLHGEAGTMASFVLALPEPLVREHACLLLTAALYLLNTIALTTGEQHERRSQQARQLITRVEMALQRESDEIDQEISVTGAGAISRAEGREARAAEDALLHRRLRLLHIHPVFFGALARGDFERLSSLRQEIEEELEQDEEAIWQMVPLGCRFILHFFVWQTGAQLLPRLLSAKRQVSRKASPFATLRVRQYLVYAALEAGQLRLAYEESQAALDLIEQLAGYALLKWDFEIVLARVWYQWNHLEEARHLLHTVVQDAVTWQYLDVLGWGYAELMQVALASGEWSLAQQTLQEVEQLAQHERSGTYPGWFPTLQAQWWLAQGQVEAASHWAAGVVFPQEAWEGYVYYNTFPVVIRVSFAQRRWTKALELLDRWSSHLDRQANTRITLTYLAQLLVALHQTDQHERARAVAARLFALTEPEGYVRVYLDEGDPMKQALKRLLDTSSDQQEGRGALSRAFVSRLLAAFEQEEHTRAGQAEDPPATARDGAASSAFSLLEPLTTQERRVLRLLAAGRSTQQIAANLGVSVNTVKTHLKHLYSKLQVKSRTQASAVARERQLL